MDAVTAIDLKIGMFPGFRQINMIGSDFTFGKEQGRDFESEYFLQIFEPYNWGDFE